MQARPPVRCQLVKMLITIEPLGIFYHILHTYACQHSKQPFSINMGLLNNCQAYCGQFAKIIMTLEPNRIFGSKFAY